MQSQQADIGRLVVVHILAGSLAQGCGVGFAIQHIVHHLKRQPDQFAETIQLVELRLIERITTIGAEQDRRTDQRARLVDVHLLQLWQRQLFANAGKVDGLSACHAARTAGDGQQLHHLQLSGCVIAQALFGK